VLISRDILKKIRRRAAKRNRLEICLEIAASEAVAAFIER